MNTVKLVLEEGKVAAHVARDLGISEKTLYGWITQYKNDPKHPFVGTGNLKPDAQATRDLEREIRELKEENENLKKSRAHLQQRPEVRYQFIYDHRFDFSVQRMCQVLQVYRSGYYAWLKSPDSARKKRRKKLIQRIHQIFLSSRRLYGSPKITQVLRKEGLRVSQKTVAGIMRENGLKSRTVRKYKATTNSKHSHPVHDNVLNQTFQAQRPNQVWMSDITYVWTNEGWLYVASVMDLFTRKIVGWKADSRMTKELVIDALEQAYQREKPDDGILHHSDRGSQYASREYQDKLKEYKMIGSMSRKGCCYDNACIESFHSVIKRELIHLETYTSRARAKRDIWEYIEVWYNRRRIHSSIRYQTPVQFQDEYRRMSLENVA
ncbi:IS3 family transposase [Alicyclobacillus fastidiosus]|uniref:IS3 family transposase n=1 Tax=Alicyclobacillus fastidiosus TaxID=392011 RepID=A0ABV5AMW0_9BACL